LVLTTFFKGGVFLLNRKNFRVWILTEPQTMVGFEHLKALLDAAGENMERRDHALHLIFEDVISKRHGQYFTKSDIAATLFRLYYIDGWSAARTFFCCLTGVMLDDSVFDDDAYAVTVYFRDVGYVTYDLQTIISRCYESSSALNELYFSNEEEDSDEEEEEEEEDSEYDEDEEDEEDEEDTNNEDYQNFIRARDEFAKFIAFKQGNVAPEHN
jgi:hypothetical protein